MSWTIGPFDVADADEVGRVHVRVWQEAYDGLMPAAYLDGLDPASFAAVWRTRDTPRAGVHHWVARDAEGVVALASSGPARDDEPPTALELYAINVLRRAHGTGLAHDLLSRAIGERAAYLWVADGNERAIAFYRRHGFTDEGGRKPEPDTGVLELRLARGPVGEPA